MKKVKNIVLEELNTQERVAAQKLLEAIYTLFVVLTPNIPFSSFLDMLTKEMYETEMLSRRKYNKE